MIHIQNSSYDTPPVELVIDTGYDKIAILIYPYSQPLSLARQLCYKNNLEYKLIPTIAQKIRQMIHENFEQQYQQQIPIINRKNDYSVSYEQKQNKQIVYKSNHHHLSSYMRESRASQNTINMNRGELLYQRNMRLQEMKKRHLQSLQEQLNDRKHKDLTFQPKINKLSSIIADRLSSHNISVNQRNNRKRAHKSMIYQAQKEKSIMEQCTFKPKINKSNNLSDMNRYQSLYEDNYHRQFKLNKMQKLQAAQHNYKPEINRISNVLVGSVCFQQRLSRDIENRQNKKHKREEQQKSKSKHRPMTGRPPALRNIQNLPVGDYLYNKTKKLPLSTPTQKQSFVDSKSQKIYQIKKLNIFQSIFDFLDVQQEGEINWQNDYSDILDPQLWQLIYPVMEQMTQMRVSLNKQQFVNSLQQLWKTFSLLQRNKVLRLFKSYGEKSKQNKQNKQNNISRNISYCDASEKMAKNNKSSTKLKQGVSKTKIRAFR